MTKSDSCKLTPLVDAHFAGKSSVAAEVEMRRHLLDGCGACRLRYTRQALLMKMQPGARNAEDRIAMGLGLSRRPRARWWLGLFPLLAAAGVLLLARGDGESFQSRGGPAGTAQPPTELLIFRIRPDGSTERATDRLSAADELAFAYRNGEGRRHLFIFGVDEHQHVFWFSPAWTDPQKEPPAALAAGDKALHEIESAASHRYDGTRLAVHALFTDRPWRLRDLEAMVTGASTSGSPPAFPQAEHLVRHFTVTP